MALVTTAAKGGAGSFFDSGAISAPQASFDVTGIPSSGADLFLVVSGRSTRAAQVLDSLLIRLNGDSGANYYNERGVAVGGGGSFAEDLADTSYAQLTCPAANSPAGIFAGIELRVVEYASASKAKTMLAQSFDPRNTTTGSLVAGFFGAVWNSTAAVNRITLSPANGSWDTGSRCRAYLVS